MDRRTFLKLSGSCAISISAGCNSEPAKHLFSMVRAPQDMVAGQPTWYATTCRECPAGCGMLAKIREGRVIKVEGNPLHPINRGRLCMRGQATLQGIYNPDRIKTALLRHNGKFKPISYARALSLLAQRSRQAADRGPDRVYVLTESVGEFVHAHFSKALAALNSTRLMVFEPFAYEALKTANRQIFGLDGLCAYRMQTADLIVSLGADFLETWLSPVEYARKFKAMHAARGNAKTGRFFHIGPYRSLTAANADRWLACRPGAEAFIAMGLIRQALNAGAGGALGPAAQQTLRELTAGYRLEKVAAVSGISTDILQHLSQVMLTSRRPLFLGTPSAACGPNALQANIGANLLQRILDPELQRIDFNGRHRVETAHRRSEIYSFCQQLAADPQGVLLLHNANLRHCLPPQNGIASALAEKTLFTVSFSNFMDATTRQADLVLPVRLPLESWGEYGGKAGLVSTLQPAMPALTGAPHLVDVLTALIPDVRPGDRHSRHSLYTHLKHTGVLRNRLQWAQTLQKGGIFQKFAAEDRPPLPELAEGPHMDALRAMVPPQSGGLSLIAAPSIRVFDGRGANRPWLSEIPDPLTKVAWQTPVQVHPATLAQRGLAQGSVVRVQSEKGVLETPAYASHGTIPDVLIMEIGQGHAGFGRYAQKESVNPFHLFPARTDARSGGPTFYTPLTTIKNSGQRADIVHTDGSRTQHGRRIALTVPVSDLVAGKRPPAPGLTMETFPLTLPLPAGYDKKRDFYPAHPHSRYRWSMIVDLDRCIGCGACAAACYAENNLAVVGKARMLEGREMSWMRIERYLDPEHPERVVFLPMLCQHCDNAPCEPVCPVYAPHHSKEGINNQIYNRCIGTRFCSQNCPYKVRRFNWFDWQRPDPLPLQLNPDVTVRAKGVMEKCSFCVQRIKDAHDRAKNAKRAIFDGEVTPACAQTCPTQALTFGNLMDPHSRVARLVHNPRAYQVMGYLNTKPAVIYLKKVIWEG